MLSDEMLRNSRHNYGSHAQDVERATKEDWASRVAKLERVAEAAKVIVHEHSGESLFSEGFISEVMMDELAEALKELEE